MPIRSLHQRLGTLEPPRWAKWPLASRGSLASPHFERSDGVFGTDRFHAFGSLGHWHGSGAEAQAKEGTRLLVNAFVYPSAAALLIFLGILALGFVRRLLL